MFLVVVILGITKREKEQCYGLFLISGLHSKLEIAATTKNTRKQSVFSGGAALKETRLVLVSA